jgi:hypothetical protein
MNVYETSNNTITEIISHLQENSFNSFITWSGQNCLITNLEIFPSVVLTTLFKGYTLETFTQLLETLSIKYTLKKNTLKIIFPNIKQKIRKRSRSGNSILGKFSEIELKQEKLFAAILRAQEKLERAIRINKQIKLELKKSDEYQRNLIEEKSKEAHVDEIMQKLLKQV